MPSSEDYKSGYWHGLADGFLGTVITTVLIAIVWFVWMMLEGMTHIR